MESTRKHKCTLPPPVTISNFDDSDQSSSSSETFEAQRLLRRIPSEMCMVSLLEELCACYAKDSREQRILFKNLSGYLSKAKMIPVTTTQDEFQQVRTNYRIAIRNFLYTALAASHADPEERYLSMPATGVGEQIRKAFFKDHGPMFYPSLLSPNFQKHSPQMTSRYIKDFVELKRIGKGGFGSVYKVRSILDNQEYAIKKIKLKGTDKEFYEKVIREVTLLARMQHPNIVRYHTAWIDHQPSQTTPRNRLPAIEFNRQESSSSDDVDNEDCCKPISSEFETASCIIKEITDELIEEDLEFHCDPTIEEEIDESDVEFKFESETYKSEVCVHSSTKTSSRQSTTVLNSESFQLTSDEQVQKYGFSNVTASATENFFSSKETGNIRLSGTFGSYNGLRSKNGSYSDHIESLDLTDGASNGNFAFRKTDDFHSLSSTACLGTRKEEHKRMHEDHVDPSEFKVIQEMMANAPDESGEKENKDPDCSVPQSSNKMEMETQTMAMHCNCCVHYQLKKQMKSSGFQWNGNKMIDKGVQIFSNVAEAQTQTNESALRGYINEADVKDISIDEDSDEEFDADDKINDPDYIPEDDSDTEDELDEFDTKANTEGKERKFIVSESALLAAFALCLVWVILQKQRFVLL